METNVLDTEVNVYIINIPISKYMQGYNARKVISERCAHLLYCNVLSLGGNKNTRRMSQSDMGSIFHIKKINEIFWSMGNYCLNYQNFQNSMLLSSSDTKRTLHDASILVYKLHPERTGSNMYAEYTQLQLTFLAL